MSQETVKVEVAQITKEMWDGLSEKDKAFMRTIGITGPTVKPPKKVASSDRPATLGQKNPISKARKLSLVHTAPTPYYVQIVSICECCDGVSKKEGKMDLPHERSRALEFKEMEVPAGERMRLKKLFPVNCCNCRTNLMKLEKEELVERMIKLTKNAVMAGWI